ncbi:zinc finger and SCAN domain-containing protein 26-like [Trichoplusia ni]|uniref:Zinc finger and SCAN domain-containing protein 26-like n=1 Tax=Trichoplusia ni TaxID=7111 RepID=A0A7E5WIX6_TRINI|nr:zinc finger and SCAN domain-containing protein 26-like [Trichoplusia ni]
MEKETHKVVQFFELCRLCLENHGMTDIFELEYLVGDIQLCTGVKIESSDNLPHKICMRCLDVVVKARRLRDQAATNDKHLKLLFGNEETEKDNNVYNNNIQNGRNCDDNDLSDSSYDSDSPRLQIDEGECNTNSKSGKRCSSEASNNDKTESKVISVRTDLFDATAIKTSPTKDEKPLEKKAKVKCKCIKKEKDSKKYECQECGKTFDVYKKFYLHQRSHDRKNICPLDGCEKKFATKGDLEKHIRTHTGERPYQCEVCGRKFTQRGSLKGHRETVHASLSQEVIVN